MSMRLTVVRTLTLLVCAAWVLPAQHAEEGQAAGAKAAPGEAYIGKHEAIDAGRELYVLVCSGCHGVRGEGGRGPNLIHGRNVRRSSNENLFNSIKNGIAGSDMPPSPLPEHQVWQITSFIRNLSEPAFRQIVPGDADAGGEIFHGKGGCTKCHMIRGQGGSLGPDLTNAGANNNFAALREALIEPNKRFSLGFAPVTVTTKSGEEVRGVAKNNSNYSLQMIDTSGKLHLFDKRDLNQVVFNKESWMPADYAERLNDTETEDLLAFLSRQSVRDSVDSSQGN